MVNGALDFVEVALLLELRPNFSVDDELVFVGVGIEKAQVGFPFGVCFTVITVFVAAV